MRILLTGADSFVGKSFREKYHQNYSIQEVCLIKNKPQDINFKNTNVVIHLAAIVHSSKQISKKIYYDVNTDLAYRTAVEAKKRGVKHFIFLSSVKVFGSAVQNLAFNEASKCFPEEPYGWSKYQAEKKIKSLHDDDFIVSIIRSSVVYGPMVKANIYSLIRFIDRWPIIPLKGIKNKRSFVYISNLLFIIQMIIDKQIGGTYIAKDSNDISTSEFAYEIAKNIKEKKLFFKIPFKSILKLFFPESFEKIFGDYEINNDFTLKMVGELPINYKEGIKSTVKWYCDNKIKENA
jgi:UDP-glucose 4-epimerase